ncbi:MAG: XrtA/PEP-CTERM system-associated ATPase [Sphingobium sp.]
MYDQFYGFKGRPFQLTPDPHFYFESATHRKALSYLGYGLAQGEGFIVITGDIGAGKTTLVAHVMATIDPARLTAVKIVSTQVEGDDMLRLVAQGFGITDEMLPKAQLLQRIEAFLHAQARKGLRTLLIVDEAQNLPASAVEELRMLSNFQLGGQSLLQIFLLGQPEFRDLLHVPEMEQLQQRVIATHHLEPMLASEIEPYVTHRLSLVGWNNDPRFSADVFPAIYRATGGVPRRINALMSRVLLLGAVDRLHEVDAQVVEAVVADMGLGEAIGMEPGEAIASVYEEQKASADHMAQPVTGMEDGMTEYAAFAAVEQESGPVEESAHGADGRAAEAVRDDFELHRIRDELEDLRRAISLTTELNGDQRALLDRLARLEARVATIEASTEDQEAALRRVLTLLVDWVESEEAAARTA